MSEKYQEYQQTLQRYWHSFEGGRTVKTSKHGGYVLGVCPITGEEFQFAYAMTGRPGINNACWSCGDDPTQTVGEKLGKLNEARNADQS